MHVLSAASDFLLLLLCRFVCLLAETIQVPQSLSFVSHQGSQPAFAKSLCWWWMWFQNFKLHLIFVCAHCPLQSTQLCNFFKGFKMLGFKVLGFKSLRFQGLRAKVIRA
jgi:hypothetical protein